MADAGSRYDLGKSQVRALKRAPCQHQEPKPGFLRLIITKRGLVMRQTHRERPAQLQWSISISMTVWPSSVFVLLAQSAPAGLPKTVEVGWHRWLALGHRLLLHNACCHGAERRLQRHAASQSGLATASASATTKSAATARCS